VQVKEIWEKMSCEGQLLGIYQTIGIKKFCNQGPRKLEQSITAGFEKLMMNKSNFFIPEG